MQSLGHGKRIVVHPSCLYSQNEVLAAGKACFFEEDRVFPSLKGRLSEPIDAVPPGNYSLVIKRDYFNKVKGAVRNTQVLQNDTRSFVRIDLALKAAHAGWEYEEYQLQVLPSG